MNRRSRLVPSCSGIQGRLILEIARTVPRFKKQNDRGSLSVSPSTRIRRMLAPLLYGALFVTLASYLIIRVSSRVTRLPYPPGPPPSFIVGNLKDLPKENVWLRYAELARKYGEPPSLSCGLETHSRVGAPGDIVHLRAMSQHIIVLNSLRATQALLVHKAQKYCSRPRIPMSELMGWDNTGMMGVAGPRWRAARRVLQKYLNKSAVVQYYPMIESKARLCARSIIEKPDLLFDEVRL